MEYIVTSLKSVSLGILALHGLVDLDKAILLSRIEERYQEELHGTVEGAHDLDEANLEMSVFSSKLIYDFS